MSNPKKKILSEKKDRTKKEGKVRLIIADDHSLFREGLRDLLETENTIEVAGEASDGEEVVELARKIKPDVILMDIKLPRMDGIKATRIIKRENPQINILILSMYEDESHVLEAVHAGANGYLSKLLPAQDLVKAVHTVFREGVLIPQNIMPKLLRGIRKIEVERLDDNSGDLTKMELKILDYITHGRSNKEIANEFFISEKTVKNHINHIFRKLGVKNRTEAVVKALEKGLIGL